MRDVFISVGVISRPTRTQQLIAFLIQWAITTLAVWIATELVDGIEYDGWESLLAVSLFLGLLNAVVKPILFLLTLPITIVTFGLFLIVLNASLLWTADWVASWFDSLHFEVRDFWWDAIGGAIIISIVSTVVGWFVDARQIAQRLA